PAKESSDPVTKINRFLINVQFFVVEVGFHTSIMSTSKSKSKRDYSANISINSTQRLLYPHSLSYQPTTFTKRFPSMTVSWLSKMQEWGLPTMSSETSGSSLYSTTPL